MQEQSSSVFKTKPYDHQLRSLNASRGRTYFADFSEMGTGKSWVRINEAAAMFAEGQIDAVLICAPNGVHLNWLLTQFPQHAPDHLRWRGVAWSANDSQTFRKYLNSLYDRLPERTLRVLTVNWDALTNKRGTDFALKFCHTFSGRLLIIADESHRVKNPSAARTKTLMKKLRPHSRFRRLMTGTPVLNNPFDVFSQMMFLDSTILQTESFFAFKNEYAEMLQPGNHLLDHIAKQRVKMDAGSRSVIATALCVLDEFPVASVLTTALRDSEWESALLALPPLRDELLEWEHQNTTAITEAIDNIERTLSAFVQRVQKMSTNAHRLPQIVAKGKGGLPKYRNLDKLERLLAPHSFRVLKKDCLDLPQKIYTQCWFEMTAEQKRIYKKMEDEARLVLADGTETPVSKLAAIMKLSQICSGFVLEPVSGDVIPMPGENPKLLLLEDRLREYMEKKEKVIVWARFRAELEQIQQLCFANGWSAARYDGSTPQNERAGIIQQFEAGELDVFIGQQQAGGTGITLVSASAVIYYSNSFSLEDRLQSEDRAHRIGQDKHVVYEDLLCDKTVDVAIVRALRNKQNVAALITGDASPGVAETALFPVLSDQTHA